MVTINSPNIERTEHPFRFKEQTYKNTIRWTSHLTFYILLRNPQLWPLSRNEDLIRQVKTIAKLYKFNQDKVKSETVLRCKRKMVEDGIIPKDKLSDGAEILHKEHWIR